jgi:perosamine synthetase
MSAIAFGKPMLGDEEKNAVMEVMQGSLLVHGPRVKAFEEAFANFTGSPHALAEGGMFITRDAELAGKIDKLRAFGVDRVLGTRKIPGVYDVTMLGYNYRMNEIQSAIGLEQVKKVPGFLEKRQANYDCLYGELEKLEGLRLFRKARENEVNSCYCLSILLEEDFASKRTEFIEAMKEEEVGTSVYYPHAVPDMTYYREKYGEQNFPVARRISNSSVALPVGPHLNEEDMLTVAAAVKKSLEKLS